MQHRLAEVVGESFFDLCLAVDNLTTLTKIKLLKNPRKQDSQYFSKNAKQRHKDNPEVSQKSPGDSAQPIIILLR